MQSTEKKVIRFIDKRRNDIVRLTRALVKIPSVNTPPTGGEKKCQLFIRDKLRLLGLKTDVFTPDDVPGLKESRYYNPGRQYGGRPNVVGALRGTGGGRSILLTGHVDVVSPGKPERWHYPPWDAVVANGRIYGCGAADMKAGLAAQISALECIVDCGIRLKGDVLFASVVDEEFGGMNGSLACVARGYRADAAILSEPTRLAIQPASAGGIQYKIRVTGKTAFEGEKEKGVNAIEKMCKVIRILGRLERARNRRERKHPLFVAYPIPSPIVVIAVQGGDSKVGGVAETCSIEVWHGAVPGETEKEVMAELRHFIHQGIVGDAWLRHTPPVIEPVIKWIDPCAISVSHPIVKKISSAVKNVTGKTPDLQGMRGACDLSRFITAGNIPAVVFGPGNVSLAHMPDEFVPIEEIIAAAKIIALTILAWCNK